MPLHWTYEKEEEMPREILVRDQGRRDSCNAGQESVSEQSTSYAIA